ncbi:ChaB family protein [Terrabacter lapilli]|uniref:ChaB family protein n=1 Tax=Terrabacter lapilli TaxID=436231 RepID=A0ABN2SIY8_9MICO|nr:ChaB family protein [Terrabacter sp.]
MPAKKRSSSSSKTDLPSTLERSPKKAQETWQKTHDSAVEEYGEGERAHRTAYSSLKHSFEKVGDHWEAKDSKGPSDAQAARRGADARRSSDRGDTAGGVDANASKKHLYDIAQRLDVRGRSRMSKDELVDAIQHANDRATAKARKGSS